MEKFVPFLKKSKKQRQVASAKKRTVRPAIRTTTVRHKSAKDYDRKRVKAAVEDELV